MDNTVTGSQQMGRHPRPHIDEEGVAAISALGSAQRLDILLALGQVEREHHKERHAMTFSELHAAVDIESSSQFTYHLNQLVGHLIRETENGYQLTYSGTKLLRILRSGVYESPTTFDERAVDGACFFCEERSLVAMLEDERFRIRCTSCEAILITDFFPESQARGRTPTEIIQSFGYRIWGLYIHLRGGVCPECFGPVETTVDQYEHGGETLHIHNSSCEECHYLVSMPIIVPVAFHPPVSTLLYEHGISVLDLPLWELFELTTAGAIETTIIDTDPFEGTVTISLEERTMNVKITETAVQSLESHVCVTEPVVSNEERDDEPEE